MQIQNSKEKNYQFTLLKSSLLSGLSGCFGVFCQTMSLLWHLNVQNEKIRLGLNFKQAVLYIYRSGGITKFYKGFSPSLRAAALARFGDNTLNTLVMREINHNNNLKNISVFIKSALVWIFAGTWRLAMMPLLAIGNSSQGIFQRNIKKGKILKSIRRIYVKRTKPEILSLYFWFTFHNICDSYSHPMAFKDDITLFIIRNALVGFGSMICYDLFLMAYRNIKNVKSVVQGSNTLLGDCDSKMLIKGMHGVVFCTTSNLFKLFVIKTTTPNY